MECLVGVEGRGVPTGLIVVPYGRDSSAKCFAGLQPLHLGIFRSDYVLHAPEGSVAPILLKQVEFNTISASFGVSPHRVAALHQYVPCSYAWTVVYLNYFQILIVINKLR